MTAKFQAGVVHIQWSHQAAERKPRPNAPEKLTCGVNCQCTDVVRLFCQCQVHFSAYQWAEKRGLVASLQTGDQGVFAKAMPSSPCGPLVASENLTSGWNSMHCGPRPCNACGRFNFQEGHWTRWKIRLKPSPNIIPPSKTDRLMGGGGLENASGDKTSFLWLYHWTQVGAQKQIKNFSCPAVNAEQRHFPSAGLRDQFNGLYRPEETKHGNQQRAAPAQRRRT